MKASDSFNRWNPIRVYIFLHACWLISHHNECSYTFDCEKVPYTATTKLWLELSFQRLDNTNTSFVLKNWATFKKDFLLLLDNHNKDKHTKYTLHNLKTKTSNHVFQYITNFCPIVLQLIGWIKISSYYVIL